MCLQRNLKLLGRLPSLATNISSTIDPLLKERYDAITLSAMRKHFTDDEVRKITHGFRRSPWSQDAFQNDISKLDSEYFEVTKDEHYKRAIDYVKTRFFSPDKKLKPVHFADLRSYPMELSTNIGAPFNSSPKWQSYVKERYNHVKDGTPFTTKFHRDLFAEAHRGQSLTPEMVKPNMSKRNLYNEMFTINRWKVHLLKDGKTTTPNGHDLRYWHTAFARRHLVNEEDEDKVRLVFGAPSLSLQVEMMFIWPIQAWLMSKGEDSPLLWGYETLTGGWYRLRGYFETKFPNHTSILTADWSGFDRRARHDVIKDIHSEILRPMFDFEHGYHPTHDYPSSDEEGFKSERLETLWNWMTDAILSTPLMMNDGTMYQFQHSGIYSGYLQTQLLDSIYNLVVIYSTLFRLGIKVEDIELKVQGDDSIIALRVHYLLTEQWMIPEFERLAAKHFGSVLSIRKTEYSDGLENVEVLKYRNSNGLPYRDPFSLLAQLVHPEGSYSLEALKARAVGIAYASVLSDLRVYRTCESIFESLPHINASASPKHQGGLLMFMVKFMDYKYDFTRFPTKYEVCQRLMDERPPLPSKRYWPLNHFIGLPGW
nr:MAG: RNA-dependent RNA polymerase [Rhizoctonia solani dsRNA virus 15]